MPDGIDESDLDAELACLEDEWAAEEVGTDAATVGNFEPSINLDSLPSQPSQQVNISSGAGSNATRATTNPALSTNSYI